MSSLVLYCVVKTYTAINWLSGAVNTRSTDSKGDKKAGLVQAALKTSEQRQIAQLSKENEALTRQLEIANDCIVKKSLVMNEATTRYGITEGQLTVHQDRGSPMTAHGYLEDMKALDVATVDHE